MLSDRELGRAVRVERRVRPACFVLTPQPILQLLRDSIAQTLGGKDLDVGYPRRGRVPSARQRPSAPLAPLSSGPSPPAAAFDFRAHFCHSAPMETHTFGFRLRANAPEAQKGFPISRPVPTGEHARHVIEVIEKTYKSAETDQAQTLETTING